MEMKNLKTNEITNLKYEVSQEAGKFKTNVYQPGFGRLTFRDIYFYIFPP
jgi:hypothetical protein